MFILLLAFAVVCLGSWVNLFRTAGRPWRFELFSIDFALGAIGTSCLLAFVFGSFGSELSVSDRLAVAGLRSQAYVLAAGFLFNLGNMLLLGTVSLLGIGRAFVLVSSASLTFATLAEWLQDRQEQTLFVSVLAAIVLVASVEGVRRSEQPTPKSSSKRPQIRRSTKALLTGLLAGLFIGASYPLADSGLWGELGLHADAGLLLYALGLVVSALPFSVYLMNIAIEGGRLPLKAYWVGTGRQHMLGLGAGLLWAVGTFAAFHARDTRNGDSEHFSSFLPVVAILLSAPLTLLWSWIRWPDERPPLTSNRVPWALAVFGLVIAAVVALLQLLP